ncbi:UvrD-helicase domain-containing protein [Arcobacter sp. 15-2]|uniref:AAA family ATPase n=1 Tax=Arcobacter sp. 15-2 TaxID=3374109 RepID=UPI00399CB6E5
MNITKQQQEILESVQKYKSIKINAFAGTGKTTTLKLISQTYPTKKILYLAFNSAIKNEATSIFPSNTHVKTTHGLAFGAIKKNTNIDLNKLTNYRAIDISKEFEISYNQAISAIKIFDKFCNSTQKEIETTDIEHKTAKNMFDRMLISKMKPTHSFYLKYYYLLISQGQIQQFNYDIIMLDEAQDTNDVTLGIFESLSSKVKIYVGDEHQQIYSFRGSKNALNKIKSDKKLYLSCSFRFNQSIASYANILLKNFKNEVVTIDTLKEKKDDIIETNGYISRTNGQLISIISNRIENRKPFVTVRDPNEIFNLTIEVHYILTNKKEDVKRNKFLKDFNNDEDILDYANEVDDYELKSALKMAKEYKEKLFEFKNISEKFYTAWKNKSSNGFDKRVSEILFLTTAHTAKGLEWDEVTIADDFTDFADLIVDFGCEDLTEFQEEQNYLPNQELLDEFNLFYVAVTRAKKKVIKDSENFHYLMAKNIKKLINGRIKESKEDLENIKSSKKAKASKMEIEDKQILRQQRNQDDGKAKNSGLKWTLEDKIKAKSMFNKNFTIFQIANKLERTTGSILGELLKSEVITKKQQIQLAQLSKDTPMLAKKNQLVVK